MYSIRCFPSFPCMYGYISVLTYNVYASLKWLEASANMNICSAKVLWTESITRCEFQCSNRFLCQTTNLLSFRHQTKKTVRGMRISKLCTAIHLELVNKLDPFRLCIWASFIFTNTYIHTYSLSSPVPRGSSRGKKKFYNKFKY